MASLVAVGPASAGTSSQLVEFHPALEAVPEPSSYNEATFERRADDSITEPVSGSPSGASSAPSEASGHDPAAEAAVVAEAVHTSSASDYVPERVATVKAEDTGPTASSPVRLPRETPPEEKRVGFFSRIFGKRHK